LFVKAYLNTNIKLLSDVISLENFLLFQITAADNEHNIYCFLSRVNATLINLCEGISRMIRKKLFSCLLLMVFDFSPLPPTNIFETDPELAFSNQPRVFCLFQSIGQSNLELLVPGHLVNLTYC
jgi:hypothetical protein